MNERKTVLIVEDESTNRKILNKILGTQYDVLEACNGEEGLDVLENNRSEISAILLDIQMPKMNGFEFLDNLRNKKITDLPVIVTTGSNYENSEERALNLGAWDYVTKPYNAKVLMSRLSNAIARSEVDLYKKLQEIAIHDTLTGLYNRSKMFETTRKMINDNPDKNFVFLRVDLDHFSLFNSSFGESEGDKLLIAMSNFLKSFLSQFTLSTCCRMNADIFCACFDYEGDESKIFKGIDDIQAKVSAYKKDYTFLISAGAFILNNNETEDFSVDDMYFRATIASKNCKNQYENKLAFYDMLNEKTIEKEVQIQNEMETALKESQFKVFLQPKFDTVTEKISGAEALVRWFHPQKGMIYPGDFISVFENNGFISRLDYYVWDKTCEMLSRWVKQGIEPKPISVNVSRVSLYNPKLTDIIVDLVKKYDIDPELFQLEITESAYMSDYELMEKTVCSLRQAGFKILMDDFGSEYSSLNTLKRIYIDVLKIDMKFLPINQDSERAEIILGSVVKMAKALGLSVVSEGVDTKAQRDFLQEVGCDYIQGYYYSKPIPESEYEEKYVFAENK